MTVLQSIHSMRELSETLDPNMILPEPIYAMEPTAIARMLEVEQDEMEYTVAEWQERLAAATPLEAALIVMEWIQARAQTLMKIAEQEE